MCVREGRKKGAGVVGEGGRAGGRGLTSSLHHLVDLALDVELGVLGFHTF